MLTVLKEEINKRTDDLTFQAVVFESEIVWQLKISITTLKKARESLVVNKKWESIHISCHYHDKY